MAVIATITRIYEEDIDLFGFGVDDTEFFGGFGQIQIGLSTNAADINNIAAGVEITVTQGDVTVVVTVDSRNLLSSEIVIYSVTLVSGSFTNLTDGEAVSIQIGSREPLAWQTGSALEFNVNAGEDMTIDVGALVSGADSIEELYGIESDWMFYDVPTQILTLTNTPIVREDWESEVGFRARNSDGVRDAKLRITINGSVLASLHNSLFFKDCVNYATGRVTVRGASTVIVEMTDNDYNTYSDEDDINIDMSEGSDPTAIDYVFVKYKGTLTSYTFTPAGGTGSAFTRTVPTTIDNYEGSQVDMEVNGWKHDLFPLDARRTATSVRMQFTGTNLEIYAVALLEVGVEIEANNAYTSLEWSLVDRVGRIDISPSGRGVRVPGIGAPRWKWEYTLTAVLDRESADAFRNWMEQNANCWFAPEFSRDPEQVFGAYFPDVTVESQYFSDVKGHGDAVSYRVSER